MSHPRQDLSAWEAGHDPLGSGRAAGIPIRVAVMTKGTVLLLLLLMIFVITIVDDNFENVNISPDRCEGCQSFPTSGLIETLAFAPESPVLAVAARGEGVAQWNLSTGECGPVMGGKLIHSIAYSLDGTKLALADAKPLVSIWDTKTNSLSDTIEIPGDEYRVLAFAPDGRTLAIAGVHGSLILWDLRDRSIKASLREQGGMIGSLAFTKDGRTLAVGMANGHVSLRDALDLTHRQSLRAHPRMVVSLSFTPDGQTLVTTGVCDSNVCVWDWVSGREIATLSQQKWGVGALTFSPDGKWLATGGGDGVVRLWDTQSWRERIKFSGHEGWIWSIVFTPDGRTMASGGADRRVRLWDCSPDAIRRRQGLNSLSANASGWVGFSSMALATMTTPWSAGPTIGRRSEGGMIW